VKRDPVVWVLAGLAPLGAICFAVGVIALAAPSAPPTVDPGAIDYQRTAQRICCRVAHAAVEGAVFRARRAARREP